MDKTLNGRKGRFCCWRMAVAAAVFLAVVFWAVWMLAAVANQRG